MVSNKGRIQHKNGNITFGCKDDEEYMYVHINNIIYKIHRIVALHFIYNNDEVNKTVVNHINEEKNDNRVENLEWCTQSQNVQHSAKSKKVKTFYKNETYCFESSKETVKWLKQKGIKNSAKTKTIQNACNNQRKAYGLTFSYVDNENINT